MITCRCRTVELVPFTDPHRVPIEPPSRCPSCDSPTTRENRGKTTVALYCTNSECPGVLIGKIHHWVGDNKRGVGILDIGDALEKALYEIGLVKDPSDLYLLTPDDLESVVLNGKIRVGRSRAEKVVNNIKGKMNLPLDVFLGSLGIDLLGRRRVVILAAAANGQLDSLDDWLDDTKLASIVVKGLGPDIRAALRSGIDSCRPLIARLLKNGVTVRPFKTEPADELTGDQSFVGSLFVFTGTRECIKEVEARGGVVQDGIRKNTTYLVQKGDQLTSKSKKAMEQGVKVIPLDLLKSILAGESVLP